MFESRIWDLRRGDADDNRFSPHGSGLRGMIIPTLLEFNYLKAPLNFILLILGPAVLVGIAPSILITYGHFIHQATTLVRSRVFVGLGLLLVLLLIVVFIGRQFLGAAFIQARQLLYALIFPVFVALREILRTLGERLGGRQMSHEQLARIRRFGTLLAALIFCVGGIALAVTVELSAGLKLVDVERVRPWAVVKAALGNAAVILGLCTVFESMHWLWQELKLKRPVLDWSLGHLEAGRSTLRVAHLSDLHLVGERYGYRMEAGMHGPRGNWAVHNALRKLAAIHSRTPLDHILLTGDITDAGTRAEWMEFIALISGCAELQERISFVPGNHDLNIVDRTNPGRLDLPWSTGPALRKLRFILALDMLQGDRTFVVDRASGSLGPMLRDYIRDGQRLETLRELAQRAPVRGRLEVAKLWNGLFPLVEPARGENGVGLILLDSNAPSYFSLTNAIGVVNPVQMKALKAVLRNFPGRRWIILLHHQLVEYPEPCIPLRDRVGLALVNAPDVLAAIVPYASNVLVFHGHRHRDWIGTCQNVVLCSAPSVSMGSEGTEEYRGSFQIHKLAMQSDGGIRLATTQRVKVGLMVEGKLTAAD